MIKRIFTLLLVLLAACGVMAQSQVCLKGRVIDAATGVVVEGAAVTLEGMGLSTTTTASGEFSICGSIGFPVRLRVSHIGFAEYHVEVNQPNSDIVIALTPKIYALDRVVVTATLTPRYTEDVPALVSVIGAESVTAQPATNTDNLLRTIPGLYIDRSNGVFSKNASVTMRGLDGANRVLILYDGAPLNKTSYGFINWSLISPDMVKQIEVVHGPSSALFGNNAMSGVINIRTLEPTGEPFYGNVTLEGGSLGLVGARASVGVRVTPKSSAHPISVLANVFSRKGDGYITAPKAIRDTTDVASYLEETGGSVKVVMQRIDSSRITVSGNYYTDKRGAGRAVYLADGSFDAYTTSRLRIGYTGSMGQQRVEAYGYIQHEKYYRQNESLNSTGDTYRLFHTNQQSGDMGLWVNLTRKMGQRNTLVWGTDVKYGWMDATDTYRTSTDVVDRDGKVLFGALFVQDELSLLDGKLSVLSGLRFDAATFFDGVLNVTDPTKNTGFRDDTLANFESSRWFALNPKLGLRFHAAEWVSVYASVSTGFMPAKLDDLCSSRKVTKGFKLANPNLKPEHLLTYEAGAGFRLADMLRANLSLFYSRGTDFQYFVATGDSIDTGGAELKPFVSRKNITGVSIIGGEASITANPFKWLTLGASLSANKSEITDFDADPVTNINLKGKHLAEVPLSQASVEAVLTSSVVHVGLLWTYIGEQWGDDVNSYKIDSWNTFDLRLWRDYRSFRVALDIFDVLDNPYYDKKGLISPGRFFQCSVKYSF